MKRKRRTEITVETSRLVIRRNRSQTPVWCPECSSLVESVTPEEAAMLAGVNTRAVYAWVEAGQLHLIETAEQAPLICLNSLRNLTDKGANNHVTEHIIDHRNHH